MYVISRSKNNQKFQSTLKMLKIQIRLAPEVPFSGYPKMSKIKLLGTEKMVILALNTKTQEQFWTDSKTGFE